MPLQRIPGTMVSDATLTGTDVQDGTLTGADIQDGSLAGADIQDGSLTGGDIQDGSVATADLANAAVTTAKLADSAVTRAKVGESMLAFASSQATTSGVFKEFLSIPSTARRLTLILNGVSTSGAANLLVQVGTGGTPTTSGYTGSATFSWASGVVPTTSTAGIPIFNNASAYTHTGHLVLMNMTGNTWLASGQFVTGGTSGCTVAGGVIALAGALDYLRLVTANGTDTLDAGSVNLAWE
jgi:hypothetical protein